MKKLVLMAAIVMMAFTASIAQDRQHTVQTTRDQTTRDRNGTTHSRVTTRNTDSRVHDDNGYQSGRHYRSRSRRHHSVRVTHYNRDGQ